MRKKKKEKKIEKVLKPQIKQPEVFEEAEKHFDFGGLPARDLKKNLGCG